MAGRHARRGAAVRRAAGLAAGTVVAVAGTVLAVHGTPGYAAVAGLPHVVALRYSPDGVQLTCARRELGWWGLVFGDGPVFTVRCGRDGRAYAWDVVR